MIIRSWNLTVLDYAESDGIKSDQLKNKLKSLIEEEIKFNGHRNIRSLHTTTIEITKDRHLSINGDCIIGVNANKSCLDINDDLKSKVRDPNSFLEIELIVEPYSFIIKGIGDTNLSLTHTQDIVLRKSNFICSRTLSINCNFSAINIPRKMIALLKDPYKCGVIKIKAE